MIRTAFLLLVILLTGCSKEHKHYYDTGELLNVYSTKNGKMDGKSITYYKNGEIKGYKLYRNGGLHEEKIFNPEGSLSETRTYHNGELIEQYWYDTEGQITFEAQPPKARMFFYSEFNKHLEIEYLSLDTTGYWKNDTTRFTKENLLVFDSLEIYRTDLDTIKILTFYNINKGISIAKRPSDNHTRIDTVRYDFINHFRDSVKIEI
jgi:hypothetical protein